MQLRLTLVRDVLTELGSELVGCFDSGDGTELVPDLETVSVRDDGVGTILDPGLASFLDTHRTDGGQTAYTVHAQNHA